MNLSDPRQFERAYKAHAARVRTAAMRVLSDSAAAEDVAQEVFIRLWQRPKLFDPQRGSLGALVAVMARSRALDRLRAEGAHDRARDRLGEVRRILAPASEESPVAALERRADREQLRAALLRLPPAQREAARGRRGARAPPRGSPRRRASRAGAPRRGGRARGRARRRRAGGRAPGCAP